MSLLRDFDSAIADAENIPRGFQTDKNIYDCYMNNAAWDMYLGNMSLEHRAQFGDGSGGELKEKNGCPPKMASFGSSSRMIYQLSKGIPNFVFEKQLSTVIGGVANLDGYWAGNHRSVFVEAKCREPYGHTSRQVIKQNYKSLYLYLQEKMPDMFSCEMEDIPESRDMRVTFFCRGNEVIYFDIKQMLCHLLGIANWLLSDNNFDSSVQFLYLLYNPVNLNISMESRGKILQIYQDTCRTAKDYDFKELFYCVVDFLMEQKEYPVDKSDVEYLKEHFMFTLCDQNNYHMYF